jgi:hypothetical protein
MAALQNSTSTICSAFLNKCVAGLTFKYCSSTLLSKFPILLLLRRAKQNPEIQLCPVGESFFKFLKESCLKLKGYFTFT